MDGTVKSYQLASDVDKGSLTFNGDGGYSFDPNGEFEALAPGESEEVTFTYTATDSNSGVIERENHHDHRKRGVNDIPVALDGGIIPVKTRQLGAMSLRRRMWMAPWKAISWHRMLIKAR
ncbi:hypothetical protein BCU00_020115 [Vibrio breoganii]|uniref:hypothetical protein n=1 Tax=Vibrio breoganii TaxID=553239 RepID=UPI0039A58C5C